MHAKQVNLIPKEIKNDTTSRTTSSGRFLNYLSVSN
jgi:hypothetical protein